MCGRRREKSVTVQVQTLVSTPTRAKNFPIRSGGCGPAPSFDCHAEHSRFGSDDDFVILGDSANTVVPTKRAVVFGGRGLVVQTLPGEYQKSIEATAQLPLPRDGGNALQAYFDIIPS